MATNYENLKTALIDEINKKITSGTVEYYHALILVDQYIAALQQLATASKTDIASYSHTGVNITRRNITEYHNEVNRLRRELDTLLYGCVTIADFSSKGVL